MGGVSPTSAESINGAEAPVLTARIGLNSTLLEAWCAYTNRPPMPIMLKVASQYGNPLFEQKGVPAATAMANLVGYEEET